MKNNISTFFVDGVYSLTGKSIPSCIFPFGADYTGTTIISSVYVCNDVSLPLQQKSFTTESDKQGINRLTWQNFNVNCNYSLTNNFKSSVIGKYKINGNKLCVNCSGFIHPLGRNAIQKYIIVKTETGYNEKYYYLNDKKEYILFVDRIYTKI